MVDWPSDLVRDIARRRCVLVIGSGVSAQATTNNGTNPPTWKKFLEDANGKLRGGARDYISEAINKGDLLHACEWLQFEHGHTWNDILRGSFKNPRFMHVDVHRKIALLDSRIIFSLNFDDILDRALQEIYQGSSVTKLYYDDGVAEFLRGTSRYLVKVHGSLDEHNKVIFTQRQYAQARIVAAPFYNAFDSALMTHTFLFLGAGYSDPDINLVLENQNFTYNSMQPHYFLNAKGLHIQLKNSLRQNRNLEIIEYDKQDDKHTGFVVAISELLARVEEARQTIAQSLEW